MPLITIDVSPEQRDDLLYELLSLYGVKAEAIYHAANSYLTEEEPLDALLRHRADMTAVDALIEQLGWQLRTAQEPARVTGESHLLADISHAALANAVENLSTTLSDPRVEPQQTVLDDYPSGYHPLKIVGALIAGLGFALHRMRAGRLQRLRTSEGQLIRQVDNSVHTLA